MRIISIISILIICLNANAQKRQEKLYFFITKDSLIGVKEESGEILIKPRRALNFDIDFKKPISEKLIYLDFYNNDSIEPNSCMAVYNRKGEFLFAPFMFDNGPDGYVEGLMRFVKNGKIGFANRNGDVVIEPKYDYAEMFNYGLAAYCIGCDWKYSGEHAFPSGGTWGYIDSKGNIVNPTDKKLNSKDQIIEFFDKFLPYQFSYSKFEQKILDSFYRLPLISKTHFVNYYDRLDSNESQLRYEIVERPSSYYPYYHIKAFEYSYKMGYRGEVIFDLDFFVDRTGRDFFVFDYYDKKIALGKWLKKEVKDAKLFLKSHTDALYKF